MKIQNLMEKLTISFLNFKRKYFYISYLSIKMSLDYIFLIFHGILKISNF